jgi:hypothetical protein
VHAGPRVGSFRAVPSRRQRSRAGVSHRPNGGVFRHPLAEDEDERAESLDPIVQPVALRERPLELRDHSGQPLPVARAPIHVASLVPVAALVGHRPLPRALPRVRRRPIARC